jgi:hypothetical protein
LNDAEFVADWTQSKLNGKTDPPRRSAKKTSAPALGNNMVDAAETI